MKKHLFFLIFLIAVFGISYAQTTSVTLKVIDETKGGFTSDNEKVFSWVAMWAPSYAEYSNTGLWYSNFFDGYTGGKLEKSATAWTWSYTFAAKNGSSLSWNPSIGTPGEEAPLAPMYGLRESGENINFYVSSTGAVTGEVTVIFTDSYVALADVNGNITNKQSLDFEIPVKVIDKTMGSAINSPVIGTIVNRTNSSEVISNNNDGWCHFSPDYQGGELQKNEYEWIYSFTFSATSGNEYNWSPAAGTIATPEYLLEKYNIAETSAFSIDEKKVISGKTILVILDENKAVLIEPKDEMDYLGDITDSSGNDFLHAHGRWIVDEEGNRVLLRGIGLGNYQLLEPYMWSINSPKERKSDTQQAILNSLAALVGEANVNTFMDEYRKSYMAETDVKMLKERGFNSIRLPMHYNLFIEEAADINTFKEKGFAMVDELLGWCKKHEIYLILDMHAVPGGQSTDKAISDQYSPGLWDGNSEGTSLEYQTKLIILWKEIARRYADEKWIGGYDLINEIQYYPSRDLSLEIRSLYERITAAIREVDKKHILFIEGNGYANDHKNLTPPWDDNMAYSFHRYWAPNTQSTIQYILDIRDTHKVPVWMGESGENSNTWFTDAVELLEDNGVGWAWWAYKKLSNISGYVSIPRPEGWDKILSYLQSSSDNSASLGLDAATTQNILMKLAENTKLENAKINKDVIYAMMDQPYNNNTQAYGDNVVPGVLFANEYDLGRNAFAYNETGILSRESQSAGAYNEGWVGRNDAVDMEVCTVAGGNGFNIGWTDPGEWLNYTVKADYTGKYRIEMSYAVSGSGTVTVKVNGNTALDNIALANTGAWNSYKLIELGEIELQKGTNVIQICVVKGFNYAYLALEYLDDTGIDKIQVGSAVTFNGIYPNPVENNTTFAYSLQEDVSKLQFQVFSLDGRLADSIEPDRKSAGIHSFGYNVSDLSAGVYQVLLIAQKEGQGVYKRAAKMLVK